MKTTDGPTIGKLCNDLMIDMKIAELRKTIKTLEARIAELQMIAPAYR